MKKRIKAILLALAILGGTLAGDLTIKSYATEASSNNSANLSNEQNLLYLKAYVDDNDKVIESLTYQLADEASQNKYKEAIEKAKEVLEGKDKTSKVDEIIKKIDDAKGELIKTSEATIIACKKQVIVADKLSETYKDKKDYKESLEKIKTDKENLKGQLISEKPSGAGIKSEYEALKNKIDQLVTEKNIEQPEPKEDFVKEFDEKYLPKVSYFTLDDLREDAKKLLEDLAKLKNTDGFKNLEASKREAIEKASTDLETICRTSNSYDEIFAKLKDLAQLRIDFHREDFPDLKTIKVDLGESKQNESDYAAIIGKISEKIKENSKYLKKLEDDKLKNNQELKAKYNSLIAKAFKYAIDYAKGDKRPYEDYLSIDDELARTMMEIDEKYQKDPAKPSDDALSLEQAIAYAKNYRNSLAYKISDSSKQAEIDKLIKEAEELLDKYKNYPLLVSGQELKDKVKEINSKIDYKSSSKNFTTNREELMKKLKDLVGRKDNLRASSQYTNASKEYKNAYDKALEYADSLIYKDSKGEYVSLDDLNKAYDDLLSATNNLDRSSKNTKDKLEYLLSQDSTFRESDTYKKVLENSDKKDVIKNYENLIDQAKNELDKTSPSNSEIERIYNSLVDAIDEIKGNITKLQRILRSEVYLSKIFKDTSNYKNAKNSTNAVLKKAQEEYDSCIDRAKYLISAKLDDSTEASILLLTIQNSRKFIDGEITEDFYLVNKYYNLLKLVKDNKNYKNLGQVSRDRIEKALKLAEDAINNKDDEEKTKAALSSLEEALRDESVKKFIGEIKTNDGSSKDKAKQDLSKLVETDKLVKEQSFQYSKAQKVLRDAYDKALEAAKDVLNNGLASEDEIKTAYNNLLKARNALDGNQFQDRLQKLADKFTKEQELILDLNKRKELADKINALGTDKTKTMDDLIGVEKEFEAAKNPKLQAAITTQTLTPPGVLTTSKPLSTVTNPGAIVKTGINSIAKVAGILVVAALILTILNKLNKKEK